MIKKSKEIHNVWADWQKLPKELQDITRCIIGKWHYFYQRNGKKIGLIKLNNDNFYSWEACGSLGFKRFTTKKQAEKEIFKKLNEEK